MPPKSKIGNYFSRLVFFLGTGRYVPDTQSGFRLFSRSLAEALLTAVSWRRYETEAEILTKAVSLGYTVATVEIPTIYFDQNRRTHFDPLWDSMRVVAVLSRYALSSLAVTAVDFSAFVLLLPHVSGNVVRANVLARAFAVVAHFVLSREYVFRSKGQFRLSQVVRYGAVVVANLGLTTWLLLLIQRWGPGPGDGEDPRPARWFPLHVRGTEIDSCSGVQTTSAPIGRSTTGIRFPPRAGRAAS